MRQMTSLKIEKACLTCLSRCPEVTQLAEIAEAGGQLGVKAKDISSFTKTIASDRRHDKHRTGLLASMDFARIANIMELPIPKLENLASSVVWLGNNFATTETEILDFSMRIAGAGRVCWIFLPKRSWPCLRTSQACILCRGWRHSIQHDQDK
ncbi:phage tail tape measure protein [Paenibacillus larvae]|nr:phage tail tape measure protein [Paenibacillus larvae]MDT2261367.1 phage tail tape measure protein [Paenibacillus larvae]